VGEDLYVELTTMKQSLVTAKNRKLRQLHELYPDVQCKLIYRRDVQNLAVKYGLFEETPPPYDEDEEEEEELGLLTLDDWEDNPTLPLLPNEPLTEGEPEQNG
jgi:hypothetical protein